MLIKQMPGHQDISGHLVGLHFHRITQPASIQAIIYDPVTNKLPVQNKVGNLMCGSESAAIYVMALVYIYRVSGRPALISRLYNLSRQIVRPVGNVPNFQA
jgi:hypothetical protein